MESLIATEKPTEWKNKFFLSLVPCKRYLLGASELFPFKAFACLLQFVCFFLLFRCSSKRNSIWYIFTLNVYLFVLDFAQNSSRLFFQAILFFSSEFFVRRCMWHNIKLQFSWNNSIFFSSFVKCVSLYNIHIVPTV